jgi:ribokinase
MKYDVITIGSATHDVFLSIDDAQIVENKDFSTGQSLCLPFGSKMQVRKIVFASGGGGTNAAVTFARQGYKTAAIGVIGQDTNGTAILDALRREGVDAKYMQMHDDDITAYSVVLVSQSGERTILSYKGEGQHFSKERIPWDHLDARWMYVDSLGGREDILKAAVEWSRTKSGHLATNPGTKELEFGLSRLAPYWKHFDIVGMNQEEAAQLTGIPMDQTDRIFAMMDESIGGIFIMTQGEQGVLVSDGRFVYAAGIPVREAIERTGAGDAFHAGFLAEYIRSGSIEKAIQYATANASSVVMHYGAKQGILRAGDPGPWPLVEIKRRSLT